MAACRLKAEPAGLQQAHHSPGAATGAQPRSLLKTRGHSNKTSSRPWWSPFQVKKVSKGAAWVSSSWAKISSSGRLRISFADILLF